MGQHFFKFVYSFVAIQNLVIVQVPGPINPVELKSTCESLVAARFHLSQVLHMSAPQSFYQHSRVTLEGNVCPAGSVEWLHCVQLPDGSGIVVFRTPSEETLSSMERF